MTDLLVIGDVNPDIIVSGTPDDLGFSQAEQLVSGVDLVIGGSASITAHGAARLGAEVALVGVVGDDALGRWLRDGLVAGGVDVTGVRIDDVAATGASVLLDRGRDRAILTHLGAIGSLAEGDLAGLPDRPARHVHVASFFLLPETVRGELVPHLRRWRTAGVSVSVDTNFDPEQRWDTGELLRHVDVCLPNETEAAALDWAGFAGERVVKLGAAGARWEGHGETVTTAAPEVPAYADATGAGDSFNAGYLVARVEGRPPSEALAWGVAAGSLSTRGRGGTAAQPTREELLSLVSGPETGPR